MDSNIKPSGEGPSDDSLVDIAWVAKLLGVNERYVRRLITESRIAYVKLGHLIRFVRGDVYRFIEDGRRPPSS